MATISDLNISLLSMNNEEAFALIKRLRESRRIKKIKRTSAKSKSKTISARKPKNILGQLTTEQKQKLLFELTGG